MLKILKLLAIIFALDICIPQRGVIPLQHATSRDWNANSFWYSPWGKSGVHKGIDIFAKKGTSVIASTSSLVDYTGNIAMGGNVVAILGPQWRIYYYAHLASITAKTLSWTSRGDPIGAVGNTGNAAGKSTHLHYSVLSLAPLPLAY